MNMASSDLPCLYAIHRGSGGALRLYIMLYLYIHIHRTGDDVVTVYRVVSCGMSIGITNACVSGKRQNDRKRIIDICLDDEQWGRRLNVS